MGSLASHQDQDMHVLVEQHLMPTRTIHCKRSLRWVCFAHPRLGIPHKETKSFHMRLYSA